MQATKPRSNQTPQKQVATITLADREPPRNINAEINVLSACMQWDEAVDIAQGIISRDDFYDEAHAVIFEHIAKRAGRKLTLLLISNDLSRTKHQSGVTNLEFVGGDTYLGKVWTMGESPGHIKFYAEIVKNMAIRRRLIDASLRVVVDAYSGCDEGVDNNDIDAAQKLIAKAESNIWTVGDHCDGQRQVTHISQAMDELSKLIDQRMRGEIKSGVETGFTLLDKKTGGMRPGEVTILAGRTSMGKTALAINMACNALEAGESVLFVSLEMNSEELSERCLASVARVPLERIRNGTVTADECSKIQATSAKLSGMNLEIDDSPGRTVAEIASAARRKKRKGGLSLIVIDYLQIIRPVDLRAPRQEQVARISRELKFIARELKVPVLCLAQLSRQTTMRKDNIPSLADLRESGAIEQDADSVMFVHRPAYYTQDIPQDGRAEEAQIILAKQRQGTTGSVPVHWFGRIVRFDNQAAQGRFSEERFYEPRRFDEFDQFAGE